MISGQERKVKREDKGLFGKIQITYAERGKSIFSGSEDIIKEVLKEQGIKKSSVYEVETKKEQGKIKVKVKYYNFDIEALTKDKTEKEQIVAFLKLNGYEDDQIKVSESIKAGEKIWNVEVEEDFDPDESLSQHTFEMRLSEEIEKTLGLGLEVYVSCF